MSDERPVKHPNPCPVCGTFLWDDPRSCWNCARQSSDERPDVQQAREKLLRAIDECTGYVRCDSSHPTVYPVANIDALIAAAEAQGRADSEPEIRRLREALEKVTAHMDRAGGDRDGMPECPWCKAGPDGDDHRGDCELQQAKDLLAAADTGRPER